MSATITTTTITTDASVTTESAINSVKSTSSAVISTMQCVAILFFFLTSSAVVHGVEAFALMLLMLMSAPLLLLVELVSSMKRFLSNLILPAGVEKEKEKMVGCSVLGNTDDFIDVYYAKMFKKWV